MFRSSDCADSLPPSVQTLLKPGASRDMYSLYRQAHVKYANIKPRECMEVEFRDYEYREPTLSPELHARDMAIFAIFLSHVWGVPVHLYKQRPIFGFSVVQNGRMLGGGYRVGSTAHVRTALPCDGGQTPRCSRPIQHSLRSVAKLLTGTRPEFQSAEATRKWLEAHIPALNAQQHRTFGERAEVDEPWCLEAPWPSSPCSEDMEPAQSWWDLLAEDMEGSEYLAAGIIPGGHVAVDPCGAGARC